MKQKTLIILVIALIAISIQFFAGCSEEVDSKNLEQLYVENGIPVKTEKIISQPFSKGLEYNAVITGLKESSAFTTLTDKVEKINYQVGDYVEKDAIVLTFPTDNPTAQYFQAKLAYENSAATFERMKSFYQTGGISKQAFENAETSYKVAEANWHSIKQAVEVKAPISGVITKINVRESENVEKEDQLFTVAQIDKIKARIWVADRDINSVHLGQKAFASWNEITVEGKVDKVDLAMNQMKKAFAVEVVFDNAEKLIKTGITAKVTIVTYQSESSIFIERKNIIKENTNQFVYLNVNGLAKKQIIETGQNSGIDVEILNGLKPGDELIVEGQMLLSENSKLNLIAE